MEQPKISLCASAIRVAFWKQFYDSCTGNKIPFEVIFVGSVKPNWELPENFKYIYSPVKPSQCYEIAFREAKGELIAWTTDDSTYNKHHNNNLDIVYEFYKKFADEKVVIAMRPIEDDRDVYKHHHLFGGWYHTPYMAPFGVVNRELLMKLGGYDKQFICGQAENDVVMRFIEIGGRVELCMEGYVAVHHVAVHRGARGQFRKWYPQDRRRLEDCWVAQGYGAMGPARSKVYEPTILKERKFPVDRFDEATLRTESQGPRGDW